MSLSIISTLCSLFSRLSSSFSGAYSYLCSVKNSSFIFSLLKNIWASIVNFFQQAAWFIESFIFGVLEAFEYIISQYLGLGLEPEDYATFFNAASLTKFYEALRALTGLAIVLMIIFAIIAIVKQEFSVAASGFENYKGKKNDKKPIILKLFRNFIIVLVFPIAFIFIILGVNAVLTSFRNALTDSKSTIATQVLAASTYDANRYRNYAQGGTRYPIIINAYDASDYGPDQAKELSYKIRSSDVQTKLYNTAYNLTNNIGLSFNDSLSYSAGKLVNSSLYGDYYESFICTAEQYQVLADFIDYAELTNTTYYIKAINDSNVDWKYVSNTIFDSTTKTLTISYYDYKTALQNSASAYELSSNNTYEITYTPSVTVTTPVADALKSIMALLGIGEYSDNTYNEIERDSNSINVVSWATEKASIHFSDGFILSEPKTWTASDEIIMLEYYRYSVDGVMSGNNTFYGYELSDFGWDGSKVTDTSNVYLPVQKIVYRDYYAYADAYSAEKTIYCVKINGNYYAVVQSETESDGFGNYYYNLLSYDDVNFLSTSYFTLAQTGTSTVKLSGNFDLNSPVNWTYSDQILMYEYYRDESISNTLRQYSVKDLKDGVTLPVYTITTHESLTSGGSTKEEYILINGTYYSYSNSGFSSTNSNKFLTESTNETTIEYYYSFFDNIKNYFNGCYSSSGVCSGVDEYALNLSANFNFLDVSTWTYKDLFICYIYANYFDSSAISLDSLKYLSLSGELKGSSFTVNNSLLKSSSNSIILNTGSIESLSNSLINEQLDVDTILGSNYLYSSNDEYMFVPNSLLTATPSTSASTYKTLSFSYDVTYENVTSWTVGDYILFLMDEMGLISIGSDLDSFSYNAKIFTSGGKTYYRFGAAKTTDAENATSPLYLDESYITGTLNYASFDSFWNAKFYNFLLTNWKLTNTGTNGGGGLNLTISDIVVSDVSYFKDYKVRGTGGVSTKYSYTCNEDIQDWTYLDFFIKYALGNTSSATLSYNNIEIYDCTINGDTYSYLLVDNYFIYMYYSIDSFMSKIMVSINDDGTLNIDNGIISDLFNKVFNNSTPDAAQTTSTTNSYTYNFGSSLDLSDYSTWTLTDLVIYYCYGSSGFESIVRAGKLKLPLGYLEIEDEYGSVTVEKVININDTYVSYNAFTELINTYPTEIDIIQKNLLSINFSEDGLIDKNYFTLEVKINYNSSSFTYNNYYYYSTDRFVLPSESILSVSNSVDLSKLTNGVTLYLKLSENFKLDDLTTWTVTDYILIYEYAINPKSTAFKGLTSYEDLKSGLLCQLYAIDGNQVLILNGDFYNLKSLNDADPWLIKYNNSIYECKLSFEQLYDLTGGGTTKTNTDDGYTVEYSDGSKLKVTETSITFTNSNGKASTLISIANLTQTESWDIRVLGKSIGYNISANVDAGGDRKTITQTSKTLVYISGTNDKGYNIYTYRELDSNVYMTYQINLSSLAVYTISDLIREVNWPQKLLNDMQVLYPDLNWETLIATSGWLDTLGEYKSAYASGNYVSSGNSANITAAGIVLSEFFLSVATESEAGYAIFEYSPTFDSETIKSLMLALVGEANYAELVQQAEIFTEMFNYAFASILEDLATDMNISLTTSYIDNFYVSMYKNFITTVMLSSDFGEYLYTIASRVYAQYTIYETLALAADDYMSYYNYIYGFTDSSGESVDSFSYSSFHDLVQYENKAIGKVAPTYTFNFYNVYKAYCDSIDGKTYDKTEAAKVLKNYSRQGLIDRIKTAMSNISSDVQTEMTKVIEALSNAGNELSSSFSSKLIEYVSGNASKVIELVFDKEVQGTDKEISIWTIIGDPTSFITAYAKAIGYIIENSQSYLGEAIPNVKVSEIVTKLTNQFSDSASAIANSFKTNITSIFTETNDYFVDVLGWLEEYYEVVYLENNSRVKSSDPLYCYMFDVYYSIKQSLQLRNTADPDYLVLYYDYINGYRDINGANNGARWEIFKDADISGSSLYTEKYSSYKTQLFIYKSMYMASYLSIYAPSLTGSISMDTSEEDILKAIDSIDVEDVDVSTPYTVFKTLFGEGMFSEDFDNVFGNSVYNILYGYMSDSEKGDEYSWNKLNSMYTSLSNLLTEFSEVLDLEPGEYTENGTKCGEDKYYKGQDREDYEETYYDSVYNTFSKLYAYLGAYIGTQKIIDSVTKGSITFTLTQFSQNFVEDGFNFTVNNMDYTVNTAVSAQRLAEYVLGGSYLVLFGVKPVYTSADFDGIIHKTLSYDSDSNSIKGVLNIFSEVRSFATSLADYTAKIYYLSNFNALSASVNDAVLMTDYINGSTEVTQELLVIQYLLDLIKYDYTNSSGNTYLSLDTLIQLIVAETEAVGTIGTNVYKITNALNGGDTPLEKLDNEVKYKGLKDYIETYVVKGGSKVYASLSSTVSGRIHIIFTNIMTYLTTKAEADDDSVDQTIQGTSYSFDNISFKDLRIIFIDAIANYRQNDSETGEQNSRRYLTLFRLLCCNFEYSTTSGGSELGRTIAQAYLPHDGTTEALEYKDTSTTLYAKLVYDSATEGTIKTLANVENRPIEELVGLEYGQVYSTNGNFDEENGDTFIICTYDSVSGKYYPVLTRANGNSLSESGNKKYNEYLGENFSCSFTTKYYPSNASYAYPVIAKGVITSDGKPTAIKIVDNTVIFYRDDVTVSTSLSDNNVEANVVLEVGTINYSKFVALNAFSNTSSSSTMYIGASNMDSILSSGSDVTYVQYTTEYNLDKVDEFDGISVLESIFSYYAIGGMSHLLIVLSFMTVIPILFNAVAMVMRRIFDLLLLVLEGPIVTSMTSLEADFNANKAFDTWKGQLSKTVLSVFGLVLGLNIYYILISAIMNMDEFVVAGDITMRKVASLGTTLSFITAPLLNSIIKAFFIITAVGFIGQGANMLSGILTSFLGGNKVSDVFASQLSNKKPGESVVAMVKSGVSKVKGAGNVWSGKVLIQAKNLALQSARKLVPGGELLMRGVDAARNAVNYGKSKQIQNSLVNNGIMSKKMAKMAAQEFRDEIKKQRDTKRSRSTQSANDLGQKLGLNKIEDPTKYSKARVSKHEKKRSSERAKLAKKEIKQNKKDTKQAKKADKKAQKTEKKAQKTEKKAQKSGN